MMQLQYKGPWLEGGLEVGGRRGGVAGAWSEGLYRNFEKFRKWLQDERMSRLQRSNNLTKSRWLLRILSLQKYKDQLHFEEIVAET